MKIYHQTICSVAGRTHFDVTADVNPIAVVEHEWIERGVIVSC